ncbi:MAG: hypothetical protein RBG1_1C00001G1550 [candidate division Zixibacteria bacterium RBG-1]|nr:MAG: hypothetical protein RBG1_1C00001G1550 [candidate division Zixibacteria bacterium RBG-1]OGC84966.1 MAG: hypothetical protein A2V73_03100 [candidate division Zixibacteria bacterium RBG_19FT_COMBO_42_43]
MNYNQAISYLFGLQIFGIKLGLSNIASFLNYLGNPHFKFQSVHVAGTNGKGSVCAMLESILCQAGYKTGLFTSPHLVDFTERVRICGRPIEKEFIVDFVAECKNRIDKYKYTFFEVNTALTFLYFAEKKVDLAVVETGLGGRLDATNVLLPLASVITNIDLEHTDILGKKITQIAAEKGGIVKEKVPVITGVEQSEALKVIKFISEKKNSPLIPVKGNSSWKIKKTTLEKTVLDLRLKNTSFPDLELDLLGTHQVKNATISLLTLQELQKRGYKVSSRAIYHGLKNVDWPCRFQIYRSKPLVILDAAHNPAAAKILRQTFSNLLPNRKVIFIFGVMQDKDYPQVLQALSQIAKKILLTQPQIKRAASLAELEKVVKPLKIPYEKIKSVKKAYSQTLKKATTDDIICVTGSHYTLGELLA